MPDDGRVIPKPEQLAWAGGYVRGSLGAHVKVECVCLGVGDVIGVGAEWPNGDDPIRHAVRARRPARGWTEADIEIFALTAAEKLAAFHRKRTGTRDDPLIDTKAFGLLKEMNTIRPKPIKPGLTQLIFDTGVVLCVPPPLLDAIGNGIVFHLDEVDRPKRSNKP
jgi:hypothetical protein